MWSWVTLIILLLYYYLKIHPYNFIINDQMCIKIIGVDFKWPAVLYFNLIN